MINGYHRHPTRLSEIFPITQKLKEYLDFEAHSHINTDSDSEIMLQVFSSELFQKNKRRVDVQDLSIGLERMYCTSALLVFALCGIVAGIAIIGARDSHRPYKDGKGVDYMLASESMALIQLG